MSDVMMSPSLEGQLDIESPSQGPVVMALVCTLVHPTGEIEGLLTSYSDLREEHVFTGFDVSLELPLAALPDAFGCRAFTTLIVTLYNKTMVTRTIPDDDRWVQRREIVPHRTGLTLMLSVRRQDS